MERLRPIVFWAVLTAGAAAGLVILALSPMEATPAFTSRPVHAEQIVEFDVQADSDEAGNEATHSAPGAVEVDVALRAIVNPLVRAGLTTAVRQLAPYACQARAIAAGVFDVGAHALLAASLSCWEDRPAGHPVRKF